MISLRPVLLITDLLHSQQIVHPTRTTGPQQHCNMPLTPFAKLMAVKYWRDGRDVASIARLLDRDTGLSFLEPEITSYLQEAGFIKV